MPKLELHVHLEGSVRPETLLKLSKKNHVPLPADTIQGLREWYSFTDFDNFLSIYFKISECIRTAEDIETIARDFLVGQKSQNIVYSEITYTPYTHFIQKGLSAAEQIGALEKARNWGERELGVYSNFILDISRNVEPEEGLVTAKWVCESPSEAVVALGMGGPEPGFPPQRHRKAFDMARNAGIPGVVHAGETAGPESIWGAVRDLGAVRIGHGVRAVEDALLMQYLKEKGTILEVCPTSNICLRVYPELKQHPIPELMEGGLAVTVNSDDPPMFNTTLTREYELITEIFGFSESKLISLNKTALSGMLASGEVREKVEAFFPAETGDKTMVPKSHLK